METPAEAIPGGIRAETTPTPAPIVPTSPTFPIRPTTAVAVVIPGTQPVSSCCLSCGLSYVSILHCREFAFLSVNRRLTVSMPLS